MTSRRMSFFEFWRSKKERGDLLERANQLRIGPAQLGLLLGDSGVREVLQNTRIASLLPPVGTEIFSRLTPASQQHDAQEKEQRTRKKNKEGEEKNLPKPASDLEAGKPLPFFYGDPLPELLNTPLEELDPYYKSKKMFIVLAKGNIIHRFDAGSACYLLSPFNPLRTVAIKILIHSLFRLFMMVTILTNCVFMTMKTVWDIPAWSQTMERVFTAVYTFEVIIKVLSRGFCLQRFSFLRDPWNWLDVVVVITGYLTEFLDLGKLSVLGTVPRVLKIFTVLPGVKKTVTALIQSMKGLAHVIVLMVFCLSFLAVIGQVLFMGDLRKKCVIWPPQNQSDYTDYIANSTNHYFLPGQLDALLCGNTSGSGVCPESFMCLRAGKNPNYGFTSYDSFGWSLLSVVRLISQDFWENLVQLMLRAAGQTSVTIFMVFVIPVCFCLLSLVVAVSAMLISERDKAAANHVKQREEEWGHILEVMKRTEEGKEACRAALSGDADGDDRKSPEGLDKDQRWCPPCWFVCANFLPKWNCCGPWRWLKQHLYAIITSPFFDFSIAILLIVNIIYMSMEHFPMTYQFFYHMIDAHLVFTAIFAAEMVLKLMAMDPKGYFQVGWNIFDSMIVIFSLVELSVVLDIRGFLLMRVFRLARWWPTFHLLIKVMWSSVRAVRNLTLVLLIMVFIFTMAGMQLFQQDYEDCVCRISTDCQLPRWHMNDFFHTFLIIFRVLCGEWIETMWDCMEVSHQATCLIFFMMVMVIGNLLILNLFLTLLLSLFNSESLGAPEEKQGNNCHIAIVRIKMAVWTLLGKKTQDPDHPEAESKDANRKDYLALTSVASNQLMSEVKVGSGNHGDPTNNDLSSHSQGDTIADSRKTSRDEENIKHPEVQQQEQKDDQGPESPEDCCSHKCYHSCPFLDTDTTQGGGRVWSNFRRASLCLVQHRYFDAFIIFIILLSSAALVCEDIHLHHRRVLKMLVERADQVITFLFLVEMVLKWLAFGLRKYFTNGWCWIDFLILQVSLVSLAAGIFGFSELGSVSSLRTLRALGPLRAISRFQGLKLVVHVLIRSLPSLCEVLLVYLMVWLFFSILGVNQFAGKFYYCFNETAEEFFLADVINNKSDCLIFENFTDVYWKNMLLNFDNVPNGYLSLLTMGAAADFYDVMYAVVDARWVESQPVYEHNVYRWLYFVSFIIMSSFFTFNVFIRLFINNLQGQKSAGRHIFMTEHQHKFCRAVKIHLMKPQKPVPRPQNCLQAHLFDLVTKPSFKVLSAVVILMYMVSLMVYTDQQSMQMDIILHWISFSLIVIFFTELIVKIVALRHHYFTDGWNIFDFVLITLSVAGLFVADLMEKYFVMPEVALLLRVVPIFRTLHMSRVIWRLLLVLMMSLPALFNICFLLFIVMFTYSIFGMFNFAYVKKEYMIDDMFNFETFGNSLICLFMSTTSTSWGGLLRPIINMDCDPDMENPGSSIKGNCGSPAIAIVFFTTYIFLSFLLVVCLYITVVMEAFNPDETGMLSEDHLQMFYKIWMKFDPNGSQFIQYSELSDFSDALRDPVRIPELTTINLNHMDPHPHPGDKIHYADVLQALTTQVLGVSEQMNSLKARMEDKFMASQSKVSCEPISLQKKQEDMVAAVIDGEMETESVEGGGGVSALH